MRNRAGQALVEAALVLPCLLVLLAGILVAARAVSLAGASESAAFTQTLREGRRQHDIGRRIAETILPGGRGVALAIRRKRVSSLVPSFLPSLDGRTRCTVRVEKEWREAGRIVSWPGLDSNRSLEASVDCWNRDTPSGRRTSAAVRAYLLARSIR